MKSNLYKVEYTDVNGARIVVRYVAQYVNQVSDKFQFQSDVVITSIGRVNVLQ